MYLSLIQFKPFSFGINIEAISPQLFESCFFPLSAYSQDAVWARQGDSCNLSLCVGGEFASKHGNSCGLFGSFLASVIGMVFHMLIGYSATIFYRAGKPSDTQSNSWAELASLKLVVYKFSESHPNSVCLGLDFSSLSLTQFLMMFITLSHGRQTSFYLSATSKVPCQHITSHGSQGCLNVSPRSSSPCIRHPTILVQWSVHIAEKHSRHSVGHKILYRNPVSF